LEFILSDDNATGVINVTKNYKSHYCSNNDGVKYEMVLSIGPSTNGSCVGTFFQ